MTRALCTTRPADWWDLGDDGNRLALGLCRVCPSLKRCADGDPRPHGVIRAAVAFADTGVPLPVCDCGYPHTTYRGGVVTCCTRCRVPAVPLMSRKAYWAARHRQRRAS